MGKTLGIMFTMTTYGTWLRGDERGWIEDGKLMPANPQLEEADRKRLKCPVFYLPMEKRHQIGEALGRGLIDELDQRIYALTIRSWHLHFVVGATRVDVMDIAKCAKDKVRYYLNAGRPIWGDDYDKRFCFDPAALINRIRYVERHNLEDGLPAWPWDFIQYPSFLHEYW